MKKLALVVVGTRPEAIKLIPVYQALKNSSFYPFLVTTNQHKELLKQIFSLFDIQPDYSLNVMKDSQTLDYLTSSIIQKTHALFTELKPTLVIVQGDTTTAFASALSAFYLKIPVAHIEAGLRTNNIFSPFPEEVNRRFITPISTLHFTPTPLATQNLLREGASSSDIFCVGNTVVDSLYTIQNKITNNTLEIDSVIKTFVEKNKLDNRRLVLLTCHRRESFNGGLDRILESIKVAAKEYPDLTFILPVHPNPCVKKAVENSNINMIDTILCINPVSYENLIYLILESDLIITDSGGIQEEAVSMGKNVLIARKDTERIEAVWHGIGTLVGDSKQKILHAIKKWRTASKAQKECYVYGDGHASTRIVSILDKKPFSSEKMPSLTENSLSIKGALRA